MYLLWCLKVLQHHLILEKFKDSEHSSNFCFAWIEIFEKFMKRHCNLSYTFYTWFYSAQWPPRISHKLVNLNVDIDYYSLTPIHIIPSEFIHFDI